MSRLDGRAGGYLRFILIGAVVVSATLGVQVRRSSAVPNEPSPPLVLGSCRQVCRSAVSAPHTPCASAAGTDWLTYGADAARTFASPGCATELHTMWRYVPVPLSGRSLRFVFHAEADAGRVYLQYAGVDDAARHWSSAEVDAVDAVTGEHQWTFDAWRDLSVGTWAVMVENKLIVTDDGRHVVDLATGHMDSVNKGADLWGDAVALTTGPVAYVFANIGRVDVANLALEAYAPPSLIPWSAETPLWRQNVYDSHGCKDDSAESVDGLAVDHGTVFYAAQYTGHATTASGLYGFDLGTGAPRWFAATTPQSRISAGAGAVYLVENGRLTARRQSDGTPLWSAAMDGAGAQSPVLAGTLVIAADRTGVDAFDAVTGRLAWHRSLDGAAAPLTSYAIPPQCAPATMAHLAGQSDGSTSGISTTMAAALGSGTLVVTAADGLHVLRLGDGSERWHGVPEQAQGRLHDPVIAAGTVYVMDGDGVLALAS